jgi:hypothetical protein
MVTEENESTRRKTCPSDTLSTTHTTQTALGLNSGFCSEKLVMKCLPMARQKVFNCWNTFTDHLPTQIHNFQESDSEGMECW